MKSIIQKCKKCNTVFKITILETDLENPLGYCLSCPACSAQGIYNITKTEEEKENINKNE